MKARFEAEQAEGRSLSDMAAQCETMQNQIKCYDGNCECTCADIAEDVKTDCGEAPEDQEMKISEMSKMIADMAAVFCTGDNAVTDPCA